MQRDENLLFGVFAVQLKLVTPSQIMEAAAAWATDQSKDLPDRLVEAQALDEQDCDLILEFVEKAVFAHQGDLGETLAAFGGWSQVNHSFGGMLELSQSGQITKAQAWGALLGSSDSDSVPGVAESPGRYTREREYARGGMGRVLLVHDEHLGRDIALKELLPSPSDGTGPDHPSPVRLSAQFMARFLQEARITSQLEHPSVIPVYELGHREDGTLYYTMKLVRGKPLSKAISAKDKLGDRLTLLPHFVDLCQAIAYAHAQGVIHRDIKPDNVMVGEFGETVVIDWGLAKARGHEDIHEQDLKENLRLIGLGISEDLVRTEYGMLMGTPAYMPPEQAQGLIDRIDERSDIYSLGAVLYELLTGHPPHESKSLEAMLYRVVHEEPIPIRELEPRAPAELVAICRRAMDKDSQKRYESAQELANEVVRFQSGAIVRAYTYSMPERISLFVRRNRAVVATALTALILLAAGSAVAYKRVTDERDRAVLAQQLEIQARQTATAAATREREARTLAEREREESDRARRAEEVARESAEESSYYSGILLAASLIEDSKFRAANDLLWTTPERLRNWEWGYLLRAANLDTRTIQVADSSVHRIDLDSTGQKLAIGKHFGGIKVIEFGTGQELFQIGKDWVNEANVLFSPDDSKLLITSYNGALVCDAGTGDVQYSLVSLDSSNATAISSFSPDGSKIALVYRSGAIQIWRSSDGRLLKRHDSLAGLEIASLSFDNSSTRLLLGCRDGSVHLVESDSGSARQILNSSDDGVTSSCYSDDGSLIAIGDAAGIVKILSPSGTYLRSFKAHAGAIWELRFDDTSELLFTASGDRTAKVWNVEGGELLGSLVGHAGGVSTVAWEANSRSIISGSSDGTIRTWSLESVLDARRNALDAGTGDTFDLSIDSAGDRVAVIGMIEKAVEPVVQIFDSWHGNEIAAYGGFGNELVDSEFSPDGRTIALAARNKVIYLVDTTDEQQLMELSGHTDKPTNIRFDSTGELLVSASEDNSARIWSVSSAQSLQVLQGHTDDVTSAVFSPDSTKVVTASLDGTARLWDTSSGELLNSFNLPHGEAAFYVAYDPSGQSVWISGFGQQIYAWDTVNDAPVKVISANASIARRLALNRDGTRLVSASNDGTIRVFDTNSLDELFRIQLPGLNLRCLDWSPQGDFIAYPQRHGQVAMLVADPWTVDLMPVASGGSWESRYKAYKLVRHEQTRPDQVDAPVTQFVYTTPARVRKRLLRLAKLLDGEKNPSSVEPDAARAGLEIASEAMYETVRQFGLRLGDTITGVNGADDVRREETAELFRSLADTPLSTLELKTERGELERTIRFVFREPRLVEQVVGLPRPFAILVVNMIESIRAQSDALRYEQRRASRILDMSVDGPGIDGIWVYSDFSELSSESDRRMIDLLNRFLQMVSLHQYDRIVSINGHILSTVEALSDAIEEGGPAIRGGEPFDYHLVVERSTFETLKLTIQIR